MKRLSDEDVALVEVARELIRGRFKEGSHHIGAALRTRSGLVCHGIHVEGHVGRVAVCAEAIAIGNAAIAGDTAIDTIVAVTRTGRIVPPCGMCRELISDYSPNANVILEDDVHTEEVDIVPVNLLLPKKFRR
jgi:cytidine deaminase